MQPTTEELQMKTILRLQEKGWEMFSPQIRGALNKFPDFFRMGTFIDNVE